MRADSPTLEKGSVRATGFITTKRRGGPIPLPRRGFRS
ncbi:hypothetical protein A2U01_0072521, partial [Trifolium medium]|nr:hypothetical protein [Trifolium medium]